LELAVGEGAAGRTVDQGRAVGPFSGLTEDEVRKRNVGDVDVGVRARVDHGVEIGSETMRKICEQRRFQNTQTQPHSPQASNRSQHPEPAIRVSGLRPPEED
jgi:hypothetical protein